MKQNRSIKEKSRLLDALRSDRGAVLPILAVAIVTIMVILAFVIDLPSEEVVAKQIQAAADAASLAGSSELDGTKAGFFRAKKAAVAALKANTINGASQNFKDGHLALDSGPVFDAAEDGADYSGTQGTSGNLQVTVERGLYWSKEDGSGYEFTSLEGNSGPMKFGLPLTTFANAVQVSIRIDNIDTVFAKLLGIGKYQPIVRTARSVNDSELERNVAPFAVRACDLLLETDPNVKSGDHLTASYTPGKQCSRNSILFRETDWTDAATDGVSVSPPYSADEELARRGGYYRYVNYKRPPVYTRAADVSDVCFPTGTRAGTYLNCKALPMTGTLGIPGNTYDKANADDILSALSPTSSIVGKIGQPFRALEDPRPLWDQTKRDSKGNTSNDILASWINSGSDYVKTEFYTGADPNAEFPWLRVDGPTSDKNLYSRVFWPDESDDNGIKQSFIMQSFTKNQWTNPMCHADKVAVNNKDTAKVKPVWVPVIAATERKDDKDVILCDWNKVFSHQDPSSVPVVSVAKPRIVGFMKVNAYDGNFLDLDTLFPPVGGEAASSPVAKDPDSGVTIKDVNPAELEMNGDHFQPLMDLKKKLKEFGDSHKKHWNCVETSGGSGDDCSRNKPVPPKLDGILVKDSWYWKCFDFQGLLNTLTSRMGGYGGIYNTSFLTNRPTCTGIRWCPPPTYSWSRGSEDNFTDFFSKLDAIVDAPVKAKSGAHCTPVPKGDQHNLDQKASWEKLGPVKAGVGCGGIAATLDTCSGDISLSTGKTKDSTKPALVQ